MSRLTDLALAELAYEQAIAEPEDLAHERLRDLDPVADDPSFWAKVDRRGGPDCCWPWDGYRMDCGYGQARHGDKVTCAHRLAYEMLVGPIPKGLVIDHLCRVRECVNPAHMEPVTNAENIRRGEGGAHWAAKTHCPQGHPYEGDNLYIDRRGSRNCRTCSAASGRASYWRARGVSMTLTDALAHDSDDAGADGLTPGPSDRTSEGEAE